VAARLCIRASVGLVQASCETTGQALSDSFDGDLRGLRKIRVARHLARCGRCRETLESLGRLVHMLRELRTMDSPQGRSVTDDVIDGRRSELNDA
jgi:predicted anti-sigma-YlaC factor YlaD